MIEVGAKIAAPDFFAQIAIGRRNDACMADAFLRLTDALVFPVFEDAQRFCL